jgi:hypothetical protein
MNATRFFEVWGDQEMKDYIKACSRRFTRNAELRKDLEQEAACYLSLCTDCLTIDEYKRVIYNAMRRYYRADKQERALSFETYFNAMHKM